MGIFGKKLSEEVLKACNSKEEIEFVKGLQKFKSGTKQEEIVNYINAHKSLGLPRIKALLAVVNLEKSAMQDAKSSIESSVFAGASSEEIGQALESEFKSESSIAESYESSIHTKKPELANESFENDISNFLSGFKTQYLSQYLNDIKSMNAEEATEYLQNKINPLIESIVQSFKSGYSYVGKTPQIQNKMAYERIARVEIIEDQFAVMFGEVIDSKINEIDKAGKTLDEDSIETIKAASTAFGIGASAKRRIEKRQAAYDAARAASKSKTDEFISDQATIIESTTSVYDASKKRNDVIHAYESAANEFAKIMENYGKFRFYSYY